MRKLFQGLNLDNHLLTDLADAILMSLIQRKAVSLQIGRKGDSLRLCGLPRLILRPAIELGITKVVRGAVSQSSASRLAALVSGFMLPCSLKSLGAENLRSTSRRCHRESPLTDDPTNA
jgi:hypothetical protein